MDNEAVGASGPVESKTSRSSRTEDCTQATVPIWPVGGGTGMPAPGSSVSPPPPPPYPVASSSTPNANETARNRCHVQPRMFFSPCRAPVHGLQRWWDLTVAQGQGASQPGLWRSVSAGSPLGDIAAPSLPCCVVSWMRRRRALTIPALPAALRQAPAVQRKRQGIQIDGAVKGCPGPLWVDQRVDAPQVLMRLGAIGRGHIAGPTRLVSLWSRHWCDVNRTSSGLVHSRSGCCPEVELGNLLPLARDRWVRCRCSLPAVRQWQPSCPEDAS